MESRELVCEIKRKKINKESLAFVFKLGVLHLFLKENCTEPDA